MRGLEEWVELKSGFSTYICQWLRKSMAGNGMRVEAPVRAKENRARANEGIWEGGEGESQEVFSDIGWQLRLKVWL